MEVELAEFVAEAADLGIDEGDFVEVFLVFFSGVG